MRRWIGATVPSPSTALPFLVSTAHFDALTTNNSLGCLLNALRSQSERLLDRYNRVVLLWHTDSQGACHHNAVYCG